MDKVKAWGRRWVAALAVVGGGAAAPSLQAAEIVVGQVAPLSGVLASTGTQMVLGGKIYFDWVNAQGGVHGATIRQAVVDDAYKVADTVKLTRELLAKPEVVALYGFAGTANITQLLADGVLEEGGAALVAPYTGGESLRNPFNPWIFHVRAGYGDEAEHMVQQLTTLGMNRVAVMYQDDGFGKAGLAGVEAALARRNLKLVVAAGYARNTDQVDEAVKAIAAADVHAVIMIAVNKPAAAFVKRYREAGGGAQLYNISVVDPAEIVKIAGLKNAHGLGISQVVPYPYRPQLPVVREYQALLKKYAPGADINYTSFEQFLGAKVMVEALRRAGPAPTRAKVVKALESLQSYDLGGITLGYSPTDRIGSRPHDNPVEPPQILASIYHGMGINLDTTLMPGPGERPVRLVEAEPIRQQYHEASRMGAALGMTIVVAGGDSGRPDVPSSSPYVTSVGGTLLELGAGQPSPRLELARAVEMAATELLAERYPERGLRANVEFFTAVLLEALGVPRELFTNVFAAGRTAGWCAHVAEQRRAGRILRPAARYVGPPALSGW